jgi:hypothetical protein
MSDLDQRIRDKLLRQGHDIGMLHRGLAAVLDACKELDEFDAETYSDAAAFRVRESLAYALGVSGEDRSEPTPAPAEWVFGFGPKGAESAWRCQRCREVMRKNRRACPACAYTVFDPIHREVVTPEGTS